MLSTETVDVRAGCLLYIRLHGVMTSEENTHGIEVEFAIPGLRIRHLVVSVVPTQDLPFHLPTANWYTIVGFEPHQRMREGEPLRATDPPGSWLMVTAARDYPVREDLAKRFFDSRNVDEVHDTLGVRIRDELLGPALIAAGQIASAYPASEPHLRASGTAYWWGTGQTDHATALELDVPMSVIRPRESSLDRTAELTRRAASALKTYAREDAKALEGIAIATHWLLTATDLPHGSNERFLLLYHAIEGAVQVAPTPSKSLDAESFKTLEGLAAAYGGAHADQLCEFLRRKKGGILRRSLSERFADLVRHVNPAATQDAEAFAAMSALRNDLVHGRVIEVPETYRGYKVEDTMRQLAFDYVAQVGEAAHARDPARTTTPAPPQAHPLPDGRAAENA